VGSAVALADGGKISGLFFSDYYYIAANHNADLESRNGFWYRRVYLTYDKKLDSEFAIRLRLEMNSPDGLSEDASGKLEPFVKDGYLKWSPKKMHTVIYFGLSGTPTWGFIDGFWGYRSVEKTLLDLQKLGSSRDFGLAIKGSLAGNNTLTYHAMVGNGTGTGSENNEDKKFYLSAALRPVEGVVIEGYVDFENRDLDQDRITTQGFIGYQQKRFRIGGQFVHQIRQQGKGKEDVTIQGLSVFGAVALQPKKVWILARFDQMLDANPSGPKIAYIPYSDAAKSNTIIAGVDWSPAKDVHIIPNLFLVIYDEPDQGEKPDSDLMPRLTVYYRF
jgi:hypothetical protein